jgi:hypothetical protein
MTMEKMIPCDLDHNGECLVCDCCISECAWERYLNRDYTYESKEELEKLFKNYIGNNDSDSSLPPKSVE